MFNILCLKKMETKRVLWAMKKIKFLHARLWFHSRNASGSQVEHSAAVLFKKQSILWHWENRISLSGAEFTWWGPCGYANYRGLFQKMYAHLSHRWGFLPWPFLLAKLLLRGRVPGDRAGEAGARQDRGRLLVSPTWRSRVLGRELVRNKVGSSSLFLHVAVAAETEGGCGSLPPLLP